MYKNICINLKYFCKSFGIILKLLGQTARTTTGFPSTDGD